MLSPASRVIPSRDSPAFSSTVSVSPLAFVYFTITSSLNLISKSAVLSSSLFVTVKLYSIVSPGSALNESPESVKFVDSNIPDTFGAIQFQVALITIFALGNVSGISSSHPAKLYPVLVGSASLGTSVP